MVVGKCLNCEGEIIHSQKPTYAKCIICGIEEKTYITCENGHYYCNKCASKNAVDKLFEMVAQVKEKNPLDVAEKLFVACGICGNSPHPLATASYLIACRNLTGEISNRKIYEGIERALKVPGGWCGYYGSCGAGVGLGIAVAMLTNSTPGSDGERSLANAATAAGLLAVADQGGPRCCVASVRRVMESGITFAATNLNINFPESIGKQGPCLYSKYNESCRHNKCKYFKAV